MSTPAGAGSPASPAAAAERPAGAPAHRPAVTEQQVLRLSLIAILAFTALGITFGLISGSSAIIFDGIFSMMDATMSAISIVLAGLLARSANDELPERFRRMFSMGLWHFEPMFLALNSVLMMTVAVYALITSIQSILHGGHEVQFGYAVAYSVVVLVLTVIISTIEHRANRRLQSALVALDIKGWLMTGGVTSALLVAFGVGLLIEGTDYEWLVPYVDPAVLMVVALCLFPLPLGTLRTAVGEILMVTPEDLHDKVNEVAKAVAKEHGFLGHAAYVARMGRADQVEIEFLVPAGAPPRPLEYWDDIRNEVRERVGADDPHAWFTVYYVPVQMPPKHLPPEFVVDATCPPDEHADGADRREC